MLSQLLKMNFVAGLAPENTKDYDLIVLNREGNVSFPIHDAFITNQKYKDRVVRIMEECFNNYFLALDKEPSTPQIKSK